MGRLPLVEILTDLNTVIDRTSKFHTVAKFVTVYIINKQKSQTSLHM
jgi:hypothetical protein